MSQSPKSPKLVATSGKPVNVFYVWYVELCRRANSNPISTVKAAKPKNETVLDFIVDRIKADEWTPIINALGLDTSLHVIAMRSRTPIIFDKDVTTEDKVRRLKRQTGVIATDYVLKSVLRSLGCCLLNTQVLSTLELEGLYLESDYLKLLLDSLKQNKTIKYLSLKRCSIMDAGCSSVCDLLKFLINIQIINLSGCKLTAISGKYIANVIKYQQLNRCCESWHKSLRYEEPDNKLMAGLRRITLNNNPEMGDEGLDYILNELEDDLWINALDMQKCNITENMSRRIIDVVENSTSLKVVDFRNNILNVATIRIVLGILEKKFGSNTELDWCTTTTTLYDFDNSEFSFPEAISSLALQKTKSAPMNRSESSDDPKSLRKIKTVAMFNNNQVDKKELARFKKQLWDLNYKLSEEISKRKKIEKVNSELQQKLKSVSKIEQVGVPRKFSKKISKTIVTPKENYLSINETLTKKVINYNKANKSLNNGAPPKLSLTGLTTKYSNVSELKSNGEFDDKSNVRNLFEKFLKADVQVVNDKYETDDDDDGVDNLLTYCYNDDEDNFVDDYLDDKPLNSSGSNDSLESFFQEIKSSLETSNNISQNINKKENFQKVAVKMR